ncbi:MAG: DNA methyltransferase, partial [Nitrososphaerales archaeon]
MKESLIRQRLIAAIFYHRHMAKALSRNEIRARATKFAHDWHNETRERAEAQTFWNEFLEVFGVNRRQVALFERRASRLSTGREGSIDLFWPGVLIAEHKSAGKDLATAEEQAFDYLYDRKSIDQSDLPRFVITSDFAHIRIIELGKPEQAVVILTIDLPKEIDRFLFIAGYENRPHAVEAEANIKAAQLMGRLYEEISINGYEGHDASVMLTRLLFLLFGDDTGMWNRDLFYFFLQERTSEDGSDLGPQLSLLFQTLNQPVERRSAALDEALVPFPYVNGGLFEDRIDIPVFNRTMREELVSCCRFDWGRISPAVFGSLFQSIKSKEARRTLGEHYTTEENILRVIEPLFLSDLRAEFSVARSDVKRLRDLKKRLGELKFFDPAMGCGNFIIVAYRELRRLELQIMMRLRDLTSQNQLSLDPTLGLQVSMENFGGIEIEEWPARIAETAMFLVDHQCNAELAAEFGQAPERLPIEISARFVIDDALTYDWSKVFDPSDNVFIFGNPPFIGSTWLSHEQRKVQHGVWNGIRGSGTLDYVGNWYLLAAKFIGTSRARAAFVSTNSITQGEQPQTLWGNGGLGDFGTQIIFAHRTFSWSSEAPDQAAVHCVIIGIANNDIPSVKKLWDYPKIDGEGI